MLRIKPAGELRLQLRAAERAGIGLQPGLRHSLSHALRDDDDDDGQSLHDDVDLQHDDNAELQYRALSLEMGRNVLAAGRVELPAGVSVRRPADRLGIGDRHVCRDALRDDNDDNDPPADDNEHNHDRTPDDDEHDMLAAQLVRVAGLDRRAGEPGLVRDRRQRLRSLRELLPAVE